MLFMKAYAELRKVLSLKQRTHHENPSTDEEGSALQTQQLDRLWSLSLGSPPRVLAVSVEKLKAESSQLTMKADIVS